MIDTDELKKKRKDVARDGEHLTVPLTMMDAAGIADRAIREVSTPRLDKPGFVQLNDTEKAARERLYRDHDKSLSARWKNPTQQVNPDDTLQATDDERLNAYQRYQQRVSNAWRHR